MQIYRERALNNPGILVAPRFGFGWDVFGNGKTAVRGGLGVFFDRYNDDQVFQMVEQPPNVVQPVATYTTIRELLATPLRVSPQGVIRFSARLRSANRLQLVFWRATESWLRDGARCRLRG